MEGDSSKLNIFQALWRKIRGLFSYLPRFRRERKPDFSQFVQGGDKELIAKKLELFKRKAKEIEELDKEIIRLQQSTKTSVRSLRKL
ncbi:MAG: hypothetical protein AAB360_02220, partial [Patescibacteria group bacterium]